MHLPAQPAGQNRFYEFFVDSLMRRSEDALADAKVIIDGSGSKSSAREAPPAISGLLRESLVCDAFLALAKMPRPAPPGVIANNPVRGACLDRNPT